MRSRGFTLLEIIIVVGILGVAGSLVIPYMNRLADFNTEGAVRRIVSDLTFAQSDAMSQQSRRRVIFNVDPNSYRLLADPFDYDTDVLYDPLAYTGDGRYIVDFNSDPRFSGVTIEDADIDGGSNFISYDEMGGPIAPDGTASAGGVITVAGPDDRYEIRIAAFTGRVSVVDVTGL